MALPKGMNLLLRGLQLFWTVLVMALTGNIIHDSIANNSPSIINYDMFVAVFAFLSLIYLILAAVKDAFQIHAMFPLIVDALNVLFWFCGAVATAAKLGVHSCDNNHRYLRRNGVINHSVNPSKTCTEAQASTAFLFFGFACFAVSTVFSAFGMGGGANLRGGIRRGPAMSQVG